MDQDKIANVVSEIETKLYHMGVKEVPSHMIGDMILASLVELDEVAYVRFASVYKSFHDVSEFTQVIAGLKK